MEITKDSIVSIHYTLKDTEGRMLDSSENKEPLSYLHGYGQMIRGVEQSLEGKKAGDEFAVEVEPEDGYGEYNERLIAQVKRSQLQAGPEPVVGMGVEAEGPDGIHVLRIIKIDGDTISLDGNHPLAGKKLCFNLSVVGVREATDEEKEHGHSHDDHHHHDDEDDYDDEDGDEAP